MNLGDLFLGLALVSVAWGIVSMIAMTSFIAKRGEVINFFLLRLYVIRYVNKYRQITQEEEGVPGGWYYAFLIAMGCTLGFAAIGLLLQ